MKKTLLIVDDEALITEGIAELAADLCDNILIAGNGQEAIKILLKQKVDCIVSDINMPICDGIEFFKWLREQGHNMPFIFFTAYGQVSRIEGLKSHGDFELVSKPDLDKLMVLLDQTLYDR